MQTGLTNQARTEYEAQGYHLRTEPVVPANLVQGAVEGMDAIRAGDYDTGRPPEESPWNPGDDPAKLCKIEMPQFASRAVFDVISHTAIGRIAAELTGAEWVQVWWVQLLYKPTSPRDAQDDTHVGWHQDRYYWQCWEEGSELFTAWVALSDVRSESGPMLFLRGSHRWGMRDGSDFYAQDLASQKQGIQVPDGEKWDQVEALLPPGGVSFHHNLTFHGSGPNTETQPRRSFAVHLRTDKSRPIDDRRDGLTEFIDDRSQCPVIFGADAPGSPGR